MSITTNTHFPLRGLIISGRLQKCQGYQKHKLINDWEIFTQMLPTIWGCEPQIIRISSYYEDIKDMRSTWSRERSDDDPRDGQTRTFGRGRPLDGGHNIAGCLQNFSFFGKIESFLLFYIHWISIQPQAYLDGHRAFLSKIETFTGVPFIND